MQPNDFKCEICNKMCSVEPSISSSSKFKLYANSKSDYRYCDLICSHMCNLNCHKAGKHNKESRLNTSQINVRNATNLFLANEA